MTMFDMSEDVNNCVISLIATKTLDSAFVDRVDYSVRATIYRVANEIDISVKLHSTYRNTETIVLGNMVLPDTKLFFNDDVDSRFFPTIRFINCVIDVNDKDTLPEFKTKCCKNTIIRTR